MVAVEEDIPPFCAPFSGDIGGLPSFRALDFLAEIVNLAPMDAIIADRELVAFIAVCLLFLLLIGGMCVS